ncbi:hypothetical protein [Mammaliicoccus sciuri]|uniref:hypothetical protein n=1 Tax=Mammaliicoccus sciuri TaxID=1296 RepID=UPI0034DD93AE
MNQYKNTEGINKEIEEELINYKSTEEKKNEKKQFLSLKFLGTFMIVCLMLTSLIRIFI